jgi:hypothetical protein
MAALKKQEVRKLLDHEKGANPGYFQFRFSRLMEIARDPELGLVAFASFLVLSGGVNSSEPESASCTHWIDSIRRRTRMSEPVIKKAIESLTKKGYIELLDTAAPESTADGANFFKAKCRVDPHGRGEISTMSQRFLAPMVIRGEKQIISHGSLAHLSHGIITDGCISWEEAMLDALVVFFTFHQHQDFHRYAGIDPNIIHARFKANRSGSAVAIDHRMQIAGKADWTLVTESPGPKSQPTDPEFINSTLGGIPLCDGTLPPVARFELAIRNLKSADLLYKAHVLWRGDPVDRGSVGGATPHYTVYVQGSWDSNAEQYLQNDVHRAALATHTVSGAEIYGDSRGTHARHDGANVFSYMLPTWQITEAVFLTQYRARWWAADVSTLRKLDGEHGRIQNWRSQLERMVQESVRVTKQGLEEYDYDEM